MLEKSAKVVAAARAKGITVIHAPIMFKEDASDNPNKCLGILAGCAKDKLFTQGTYAHGLLRDDVRRRPQGRHRGHVRHVLVADDGRGVPQEDQRLILTTTTWASPSSPLPISMALR